MDLELGERERSRTLEAALFPSSGAAEDSDCLPDLIFVVAFYAFIFKILFIYFGCTGSAWLHTGFS